jgi:hypothetical protein
MQHEWGDEECVQAIGGEARGRDHPEDHDAGWVDNVKMDLGEIGWG